MSAGFTISSVEVPSRTTAALPDGQQGVAYSQTLTATGGKAPYTFAATDLPDGLSVVGDAITCTPTVNGSFTVTLSDTVWPAGLDPVGVTDSDCGSVAPNPATRTFSLSDAYLAGTGDCAIRLQLTSTARPTALAPHRTP